MLENQIDMRSFQGVYDLQQLYEVGVDKDLHDGDLLLDLLWNRLKKVRRRSDCSLESDLLELRIER